VSEENKYEWHAVAGVQRGLVATPYVDDMTPEEEMMLWNNGMGDNAGIGEHDAFIYFFCKFIKANMKKIVRDHCA